MNRIIRGALVLVLAMPAVAAAAESLTYQDAWQLVLSRHPARAAIEADLAARSAEVEQAGKSFNPELAFEAENFAGSGIYNGFDVADLTLMLSQTWELGGKPGDRRQAATADLEARRTAAEIDWRSLRAELQRAFIEVLAAQRKVVLADTLARVLEEDRKAVEHRITAGAENRVSLLRANLAADAAERVSDRAQEKLHGTRLVLGALWNTDQAEFPPVSGKLDTVLAVPTWDEVLARIPQSPAMRSGAADLARARAQVEVTGSLNSIDLTTAAGVRHLRGDGDNALVVAVGAPLPVRNTYRAARQAAASDVALAEAELRRTAVDLKTELARAWSSLVTSRADVLALRHDTLPAAASTMLEAMKAYRNGVYSLTDVLAVRRSWTEWQIVYVDALADHHHAATDLAEMLGTELPGETRP